MSKYRYEMGGIIRDTEIDFPYHTDEIIELLDEKDQKIADLEAKLAESEKEHELLIDDFEEETENLRKQIKQESDARKRFVEEVKNLKQQLEEKDIQIEQLKKFDDLNKTFFDLFRTAFKEPNKVDDLFNNLKTMQEKQDQDKISFAVEQLKAVKLLLISSWGENDCNLFLGDTEKIIDNQIKRLKKGK